nr:DUF6465 family protein [uncultured Butyrivibrio sp.]
MAETKKTEAAVKPVVATKTPVTEAKKVEPAKTEAKAEAKKPAVKKATSTAKKPAVKKAEPKKETKAAAKKPATKKAPAKKAAKAESAAIKANIVLQYADKNVTFDTLVENAQNVYQYDMGKNLADVKKLDLYVKPEENTVYFVVNDKELGNYGL